MARFTQAAKVGAFVVAMSGAGYLVYKTVNKDVGGRGSYVVHTYLSDASGLAPHSRVTMAGLPGGNIDRIYLEGGRARVDIRVSGDIALYQDAKAGIRSASLLGENIISLTPGTHEPKKKNGDEVDTVPDPRSFDSLKEQMGRIGDLVEKVVAQLAQTVGSDQGREQIKAILKNLAEATEAINLTVRENRTAVRETLQSIDAITTRGQPEVARILENIRTITDDVKVMMAKNGGEGGSGGELRTTIERLSRASKTLESTLGHADNIAGRIDRGEGSLGRLTKDDTLVKEAEGVAEGVGDYVDRLGKVQAVVGLRSDYNFLANTVKSYVELRVQPREDKYYLVELINDPRGKTTFTQTDVDTTNPNDPAHYRTTTTTTTDAFRFSIQFARRMGPFTGRFGVKESTGGLGLDVHLLSNRFELVNDFFGFGEEIKPRLRMFVGYEFIHRLWLLGGIDHVFLPNRRDYFMGLQLRFTDDDLKTILPFTGSVPGTR
jgi:phospholipid/cholesterol/gamma-HCH transport system substrate-binding protein